MPATKRMFSIIAVLTSLAMIVTACGSNTPTPPVANPAVTAAPDVTGNFQIPEIVPHQFNIAMILRGPHDDGGWSQAQYEGLKYIESNMPNSHVASVENVPEGAGAEQIIRALARKGFNLIFTTSFGYMDPTATVAEEFPNIAFIHIGGNKSNGKNFGNLFGAMEDMQYLAGMVAGARAQKDANPKVGYMATFPIPEELRLGNAFALGMAKTCPECKLSVRWINTWHDPVVEKEAAASLFDAGVQVVFTGADTSAPADVALTKDKWGITYGSADSCQNDACLTTMYWNWGPIYTKIARGVRDRSYKPGVDYFDADSGALSLYGFMQDQQLTKGMADLPPEVIQTVKDTLAQMLAGKFTRFDIFSGEIKDNTGKVVVPAGEQLQQSDLDQFPPGASGRECKYCMYWWNQNISAELPPLTP